MDNKIKELENELYMQVESSTPEYIKKRQLVDIDNKNEFVFKLKREYLYPYDENKNPLGLNLNEWLINYEKEAKVSTAGIRGPQNILYPEDTRFPINMIGIMLATIAKALVAKEKYSDKDIYKIVGREVRYNSSKMQELIARIQAAQEIRTLIAKDRKTIPIWLASFLAFKLDLLGGEYITSSHGISVKNATKDLNSQGSQYLPEESLEFVNKIKQIFEYADKNGSYSESVNSNDLAEGTKAFFGGSYTDTIGKFVVVLTVDTAENRTAICKELGVSESTTVFEVGTYTLEYLTELQSKISSAMTNKELPFVTSSGVYETINRIKVRVTTDNEADLAKVLALDTIGGAIVIERSTGAITKDLAIAE